MSRIWCLSSWWVCEGFASGENTKRLWCNYQCHTQTGLICSFNFWILLFLVLSYRIWLILFHMQIKKQFRRCIIIGRRFPICQVHVQGSIVEVCASFSKYAWCINFLFIYISKPYSFAFGICDVRFLALTPMIKIWKNKKMMCTLKFPMVVMWMTSFAGRTAWIVISRLTGKLSLLFDCFHWKIIGHSEVFASWDLFI